MDHARRTRAWHRWFGFGALPVVTAGLLVFTVPSAPAMAGVAPGSTERVSVTDSGDQGTDGGAVTAPAVSGDGRYVAFADFSKLAPAAGLETYNIYVRDRAAPGHTVLLSWGVGGPANGDSVDPSISADGRYVAFDTQATNIPDGDTLQNRDFALDVVVVDRDPEGDGRFDKVRPDGTPDYRYIVVGRTDLLDEARLWSNQNPSISADGSTIAWQQNATNEEAGSTTVVAQLGKDATGQLSSPPEGSYINVDTPNPTDDVVNDTFPRLSADGRHVAFTAMYCAGCSPTGVRPPTVPGTGTVLLVEDLADRRTAEVDLDTQGHQLSGMPSYPAISGDGSVVAFAESTVGEEAFSRVIVVDRDPAGTGLPTRETIASVDNAGNPTTGTQPALSTDGRYLAFVTAALNADDGANPVNEEDVLPSQVVERDLVVDAARAAAKLPSLPSELATPSAMSDCGPIPAGATCPANAVSQSPALDADGGTVAYLSQASDLVQGDTNDLPDVFARQFQPSLQADPLNFGTVPLGGTATATITVHQTGFGPVHVGAVTVNGGDFTVFPSQTCQNATLYETGNCLVSIRFTPQGTGTRNGTLMVGVRGWPAPFPVSLTGGVGPVVNGFSATPNPLAFPGPQLALSTSVPEVITVTNTGAVSFTVSGVRSIAGPGLFPGDYTVVGDTCTGAALPGGSTCQVKVVNVPHGAGIRPGALAFTDDTGGSPQLVGLSAAGTKPTLQANPAVVADGRVTTLRGQGFPANHEVDVTLQNLPGSPKTAATTNNQGNFAAPLPVFEHTDVGTWQAQATATGTTLTATTPILVVLDTYQPPDFNTRG